MAPIATKTVFLVRHGEALHNVAEKAAQRQAATDALACGYEKGCEEFKKLVESARCDVLEDEKYRDAGLSEKGEAEALLARLRLETVAKELKLPYPASLQVSPLRRTLQTAALLFPMHPDVQVVQLLRERRTSRPCDERSSVHDLIGTPMFSHMSFDEVPQEDTCPEMEDNVMLRERTNDLVRSLFESDEEVLCLVTHKAVLRELERGTLGRAEASEFDTCEVRVYELAMAEGDAVSAVLRYSQKEGLQK